MASSSRRAITLALFVTFVILLINYYRENMLILHNAEKKNPMKIKYILYWTKMFQNEDFNFGFGNEIFKECPRNNCMATNNKTLIPTEYFDAVLFHGIDVKRAEDFLPKTRSQHQIYIFSIQESPIYTPNLREYKNFYNWTMTYRLDSDVIRPYGTYVTTKTTYQPPTVNEILNRTKKIAWLVSNCNSASRRENIYMELKKYMNIDVFGLCGNDTFCKKAKSGECLDYIEKNYKFYLAFENSICQDYVTEKLYNMLKKNIIPVVFGGADYNKVAPPNSVIDVKKFDSIKMLADFLKLLDENPYKYLKYFEWKKDFVIDTSNKLTLCNLCNKLNQPLETKIYSDIEEWWRGHEKCKEHL